MVGYAEVIQIGTCGSVLISMQLAFARQDVKERGERDDVGRRSDDSYSPRRHWRFRSPTISVGPRFAYRRVMTLVSSDDDLDWEFAFDSHFALFALSGDTAAV